MRVLLTGAAGLIGRPTARLLAAEGHEVLATDLRPAPASDLQLDVRQGARVKAGLAEFQPDAVVHLAARHFIPWCNRYPAATLRTNVLGTQNVVEAVRELGG